MALGLVFYLTIRCEFLSFGTTAEQTSSYGAAALAGLVGLLSEQAIFKRKQMAETVFCSPAKGTEALLFTRTPPKGDFPNQAHEGRSTLQQRFGIVE